MNIHTSSSYSSTFSNSTSLKNTRATTDFAAYLAKSATATPAIATTSPTSTANPLKTSNQQANNHLAAYTVPQQTSSDDNSRLQTPFGELLLPNAENVAYLQNVANQTLTTLLQKYQIPQAPSSLRYDENGNLQLPSDYPYAATFRQALQENPKSEQLLNNLNGLASHYASLQKIAPLSDALAQARDENASRQVMARYGYLLDAKNHTVDITLEMGSDHKMRVFSDGRALLS